MEAKSKDRTLSPSLAYFHEHLKTEHAIQAAFDLDHVDADAFGVRTPVRVPVTTFLSQLV